MTSNPRVVASAKWMSKLKNGSAPWSSSAARSRSSSPSRPATSRAGISAGRASGGRSPARWRAAAAARLAGDQPPLVPSSHARAGSLGRCQLRLGAGRASSARGSCARAGSHGRASDRGVESDPVDGVVEPAPATRSAGRAHLLADATVRFGSGSTGRRGRPGRGRSPGTLIATSRRARHRDAARTLARGPLVHRRRARAGAGAEDAVLLEVEPWSERATTSHQTAARSVSPSAARTP